MKTLDYLIFGRSMCLAATYVPLVPLNNFLFCASTQTHCTIPLIIAVKGTWVSCYCQACIQRVLHAIFISEKIGKSFNLTFDS